MVAHHLQSRSQAALEMRTKFCGVGKWMWTFKSTRPELAQQSGKLEVAGNTGGRGGRRSLMGNYFYVNSLYGVVDSGTSEGKLGPTNGAGQV